MTAAHYDRYVTHVQQRCENDPGVRSALRSGLRRRPEQAPRMHAVVARWVGATANASEEWAYYAIAALIGDQPPAARGTRSENHDERSVTPERRTSLGHALAALQSKARDGKTQPEHDRGRGLSALEQRLHLLTRQGIDGLHRHLPAVVGRLRGSQVPVDWAQLLDDLARWPIDRDRIAKRWLQDFYRSVPAATSASVSPPDSEE
jgi:CRISPR system Cascade subunit CasB